MGIQDSFSKGGGDKGGEVYSSQLHIKLVKELQSEHDLNDPGQSRMTYSSINLKGANLYLIGMMGAGKSTLGRVLAEKLGYRFLDTDAVIEQAAGQPISEIFAASGEAAFRALETEVLGQLAAYKKMTIATGGGIVLQRQNWSYLHHGIVVWLDVPLAQLCDRLEGDTTRPILQGENLQQKLQTLLDQRQALYAQADVRIAVGANESPEQLALRVLQEIQTVLKPEIAPPSASDFTFEHL